MTIRQTIVTKSSICSRKKKRFCRICIRAFKSKKQYFLLSHDSNNLRNERNGEASKHELSSKMRLKYCTSSADANIDETPLLKKTKTRNKDMWQKYTVWITKLQHQKKQKRKNTKSNIFYPSIRPFLDFFFVLWFPSSSENSSELKFSSNALKIQQQQGLD